MANHKIHCFGEYHQSIVSEHEGALAPFGGEYFGVQPPSVDKGRFDSSQDCLVFSSDSRASKLPCSTVIDGILN
jgi:hypothetical protein